MSDNVQDALSKGEYLDDFWPRFEAMRDRFIKIEFGQTFSEKGDSSFDKFVAGDWSGAVEEMERPSAGLRQYLEGISERGASAQRVRIVQLPLSDYLIWELHALMRNETYGERIRVIESEEARGAVSDDTWVNEFVAIDRGIAYRVLYDDQGENVGAVRYTELSEVSAIVNTFDELFEAAAPLGSWFAANVEGLKPSNAKVQP